MKFGLYGPDENTELSFCLKLGSTLKWPLKSVAFIWQFLSECPDSWRHREALKMETPVLLAMQTVQ
jgi:hypothetical protein